MYTIANPWESLATSPVRLKNPWLRDKFPRYRFAARQSRFMREDVSAAIRAAPISNLKAYPRLDLS
jgi:hypothetical protein